MYSLPAAALYVFIVFFFLTLPLRLIIYYAKSYRVVIMSRRIADWILLLLTIGATVSTATTFLFQPLQPGESVFYKYILPASGSFLMIVPYFHIMSWLVGRKPFYTKSHLQYLEYFTLYLRSFNDERKDKKLKQRMTKALSDWFAVYAIGKPDEFMPPTGAKRIYVDDDWQEIVIEMMKRSKLILHRINTSDNYLWEFEQCYKKLYLQKSVFWADDLQEYAKFRTMLKHRFGLEFPLLEDRKCHVAFYYKPDYTFRIIYLTTKEDYERFRESFLQDHAELFDANKSYLYARHNKLSQVVKLWKDSNIPDSVQRWSWSAFWLPEFYLICQQIKYRVVAFFAIVATLAGFAMVGQTSEAVFRAVLIRLITMVIMGRNGRKIVWLSRHWESLAFYEKNEYWGSWVAQLLGVIYVIFWIVAAILMQVY
ncbi:MAG: hypothetical protein J6U14_09245 [Bacteroidaceae bacterium]|nr:hypothetical protein [Bacteroidaceae bacterium]